MKMSEELGSGAAARRRVRAALPAGPRHECELLDAAGKLRRASGADAIALKKRLVATDGAPLGSLWTSMSVNAIADMPRPNAFITASFAAKRAARCGSGSAFRLQRACSAGVKTRRMSPGVRSSAPRRRSTSTRSVPTPIVVPGGNASDRKSVV